MTDMDRRLREPVRIDADGVWVGDKLLLVEMDSVHVVATGGDLHGVTLTLLTTNLTVDTDSPAVRKHVTAEWVGDE